jgi:phosphinothricin acetyltransferase
MRASPGLNRDLVIRAARESDAAALAGIYNPYVIDTTITFEESAVDSSEMAARVNETNVSGLPFLMADIEGSAAGFAYASKWKGRCAYRHTVETTVYVDRKHWQRGIGKTLYTRLLELLQGEGFHAAIGGIALPNEPSVALHERLGFAKVAQFREVGFKFDRWIDVGYWERLFK